MIEKGVGAKASNPPSDTARAVNRIASGRSGRPGSQIPLLTLAPAFDRQRHRLYVDVLSRALDDPNTRAVAVTGPYGSGKSSVLRGLSGPRWLFGWRLSRRWPWLRRRVITTLSLSTLEPQASADSEPDKKEANRPADDNVIQKELVKQLLYRLPTGRTPRSRFRRATKPSGWATLKVALAAAVLVGIGYLVAILTGWSRTVDAWAEASDWQPEWVWLGAAGLVAFGAAALWRAGAGRVELKGDVKASALTVSLGPTATTYFDQYLDEIVYFFEVSRTNVLVLEDLDRFGSTVVFDTLRALNTLVNSSRQVGRRVVFVYAIRDSALTAPEASPGIGAVTTANSPAERDVNAELDRSNRAKHFDMIVPIVPFVTTDNARDVLITSMEGTSVSQPLLRLAARHVADMRTIHSLRNEFEVHAAELVTCAKPRPGITRDIVFALVLLRATLPADFEAIRLSTSSLDDLRKDEQKLVEENIRTQTARLVELRTQRENGASREPRVALAAQRLDAARDRLQAMTPNTAKQVQFGQPFNQDSDLAEPDAWRQIAAGTPLHVTLTVPRPGYPNLNTTLRLDASFVSDLIGMPLDADAWQTRDLDDLDRQIAACETEIEFLRHHDWKRLYQRTDLELTQGEGHSDDFAALVKKHARSDLVTELIQHGYLPAEFASHSSPFYGRVVGEAASEFLHRAVGPGTPVMEAELDATAVEQVLLEQRATDDDEADFFDDPSVYNLDLVDYLLAHRNPVAAHVAQRIGTRWGALEKELAAAHFARRETATTLVALMAPHWPQAVRYTAVDVDVTPKTRLALVDSVLGSIRTDEQSDLSHEVARYLEGNYASLASVTTPATQERAQIVMGVLKRAGAAISDLSKLTNDPALQAALEADVYDITATNLSALGGEKTVSLDTLHATRARECVFRRAVGDLGEYLDAIAQLNPPGSPVANPAAFSIVLTEVANAVTDEHLIDRLVTATSQLCRVEDLSRVPARTWPTLARHDRIDVSVPSTALYIQQVGVDADLASFLNRHGHIVTTDDDNEENRTELALELLDAWKDIGTPGQTVRLVASLTPGLILASQLRAGDGPLVADMLTAGLIEDDAAAFRPDLFKDRNDLVAAVRVSKELGAFADTAILSPSALADVLSDTSVSPQVRAGLLDKLDELLEGATGEEASRVASALARDVAGLGISQLIAVVQAGAAPARVVQVAAQLDESALTRDDLRDLLRRMGGQYALIADGGEGQTATLPEDDEHRSMIERLRGTTWRGRVRRKDGMLQVDLISP